jgi:hypothetical protein
MCATDRCCVRTSDGADISPIEWDHDTQWELSLKLRQTESSDEYRVETVLRHGVKELKPSSALLVIEGVVIGPDLRAAPLVSRGAHAWSLALKAIEGLQIPATGADDLIQQLLSLPNVPHLDLPAELAYETVQSHPVPHLLVRRPQSAFFPSSNTRLEAQLRFNYEGATIDMVEIREGVYDGKLRRFVIRDRLAEQSAVDLLTSVGCRRNAQTAAPREWLRLCTGSMISLMNFKRRSRPERLSWEVVCCMSKIRFGNA